MPTKTTNQKKKPTPEKAAKKPITKKSIAKDVLKLLAAKKLVATTGTYCRTMVGKEVYYHWAADAPEAPADLQQFMLAPRAKCEVCGLGAMFVSLVSKVDQVETQEADNESLMRKMLGKYFNRKQRVMIEAAFEKRIIDAESKNSDGKALDAAIVFGEKYHTDSKRLKAICENIIKHGEFRP